MSLLIADRIGARFASMTLLTLPLGGYALSQIGSVREATGAIVACDLALARRIDDLGIRSSGIDDRLRNLVIALLRSE